jgi:hypothetical protein
MASYLTWRLAYAIGLGKILDDWNARVELFTSFERELNAHAGHVVFDYVFWDVLWVATINVPLSLALGSIWWALVRHRPQAQLRRALVASAILGFTVPVASYFVSLVMPTPILGFADGWLVPEIYSDGEFREVLSVAIVNVPLFVTLGSIWWAFSRDRKIGLNPL